MNGKCYTLPALAMDHCKAVFCQNFTKPLAQSTVVLRMTGTQSCDGRETEFIELTFPTKNIKLWTSHPKETGIRLPADFNTSPRCLTTAEQPKRIIHFQTTLCHIRKTPKLNLGNLFPKIMMKNIMYDVRDCKKKCVLLDFTCFARIGSTLLPAANVTRKGISDRSVDLFTVCFVMLMAMSCLNVL